MIMIIISPPHRAAGQKVHLDAGAGPELRQPNDEQQQQLSVEHVFLRSLCGLLREVKKCTSSL